MSYPLSNASNNSLLSFRNFAREIRKPKPYQLVSTECKGVLNILIGLGQVLVCPCFKCFRANDLYEVHMEAGKTALNQGVKDLSHIIIVTTTIGAGLAARQWVQKC